MTEAYEAGFNEHAPEPDSVSLEAIVEPVSDTSSLSEKRKKYNPLKSIVNTVVNYVHNKLCRLEERLSEEEFDDKFRSLYFIAAKVIPKILKITNKITYEGLENVDRIDSSKPVIIAPNHRGALDPIFSSCAFNKKKIRYVSKLENSCPPFGLMAKPLGGIFLDENRKMTDKSLRLVRNTLRKGDYVGIFPEGTRVPGEELGEFHKGVARLCLENKAQYVPVFVKGSVKLGKGRTIVRIGRPVILKDSVLNAYSKLGREEQVLLASEITLDMRIQMLALKEGITDTPLGRYENINSPLHS